MADYIKAYLGATPLFATDTKWTRPSDWLALPSVPADGFVGIHSVFESGTNYCAILMRTDTGTYTIDWGDGSAIETATSNTIVNHNFSWAGTSSSTTTSQGYRQAIVKVTPATGSKFIYCQISNKVSTPTIAQQYSSGWLDITFNLPNLTATGGCSLLVGGGSVRHSYLERVTINAWGAMNACTNMFADCNALQSINSSAWNMAAINNLQSMFQNCWALQYIDGSTWNTSAVTTMLNFARECKSLIQINCSNWNLLNNPPIRFAFYNCVALQFLDVTNWNTSNFITTENAFVNCSSLEKLNVRNWNMAKNANANSMFAGCTNLQNMDISLWNIPLLTIASSMFSGCMALEKLETCNFSACTNMASFAAGCSSLKSVTLTGINTSVDFSNCYLSGTALDALYGNLSATGTGKTCNQTGNFGTASDTPSIATAKGWTLSTP